MSRSLLSILSWCSLVQSYTIHVSRAKERSIQKRSTITTRRVLLPPLPPSSASCITTRPADSTACQQQIQSTYTQPPPSPSPYLLPSTAAAVAPERTTVCQTGSSKVMELCPSICPEYWSCCWPALIMAAYLFYRLLLWMSRCLWCVCVCV